MKVLYSPQRSDVPLSYDFSGEQITVTIDGQSDVFDFTGIPQGKAGSFDSPLDQCPLLSVKRDSTGELWVVLLSHIGPNATEAERFPEWEEV